jgi:hypothetical protein
MTHKVNSPIIIIGMHRSGTSMVSRLLQEAGLFIGKGKDIHGEAPFFLNINNWLLGQSGASWDNPEPFRHLLKHKGVRSLTAKYIRYIMRTPRAVNFLGWKNYVRYRSPEGLDIPWGWKDPRTTVTLPIWLDIFPDAKVVHIYRNGIDVAHSLNVRENGRFAHRSHAINDKRRFLYMLRPKRGRFTGSLRCGSLEGSFSLWEEYLDKAKVNIAELKDNAVEIKYEDFLADPRRYLLFLADFCGLDTNSIRIEKTVAQVQKSRAYAYRNKPELKAFSEKMSSRLSAYGY